MKELLRWEETIEGSKENESEERKASMYSTALGSKSGGYGLLDVTWRGLADMYQHVVYAGDGSSRFL
jgi:hypothetical protein